MTVQLILSVGVNAQYEIISPLYPFWVGVGVTVGKELVKDDRKTPNV